MVLKKSPPLPPLSKLHQLWKGEGEGVVTHCIDLICVSPSLLNGMNIFKGSHPFCNCL